MSYSDVELCSIALAKLGARAIEDFTEKTAEAQIARRLFPLALDAMLSAHPWTFCARANALEAVTGVEKDERGRALYRAPADLLRVIAVTAGRNGASVDYALDHAGIWCSANAAWLSYHGRILAELTPAFFQQALTARLAAEFCVPLTEQTSRADNFFAIAEKEYERAKAIDSQQRPPRALEDFTLIEVRDP